MRQLSRSPQLFLQNSGNPWDVCKFFVLISDENESWVIFMIIADRISYDKTTVWDILTERSQTKWVFNGFEQHRSSYASAKWKIAKLEALLWTNFTMNFCPFVFVAFVFVFLENLLEVTCNKKIMCPRDELNLLNSLQLWSWEKHFSPRAPGPNPISLPSLIWLRWSSHIPSAYMNHFQYGVLIIIYKVTF